MDKMRDLAAELNKTENGKSLLREVEPIEIPHKGYESPITLFQATHYDDLTKEINAQQEEYIMQSVVSIGVDVNKKELIKALQYDREQYEKGYKDGKEVLQAKINKAIEEIKALSPTQTAEDIVDGNPIKDAIWENLIDVLEILERNTGE